MLGSKTVNVAFCLIKTRFKSNFYLKVLYPSNIERQSAKLVLAGTHTSTVAALRVYADTCEGKADWRDSAHYAESVQAFYKIAGTKKPGKDRR